jgi:hypothetical protein
MIELCQAQKTPLVLLTPVTNLRDCPPFKMETDPNGTPEAMARWNDLWERAQRLREHPKQAFECLEQLLKLDPEHCGVHYYYGQLALADRDWEIARKHLIAAKDFDVCPLRATTEIQTCIRELVKTYGVWHVDAERLFEERSTHALVGSSWLVDHVHPSIEGHQRIGEAIAEELILHHWLEPKGEWRNSRNERYRAYLATVGEHYFQRGKQRLEGLMLWTQGRAKKIAKDP